MHGNALFNDNCIACHGADAGGQADGSIPNIASQQSRVIIQQLVNFRHGERSDLRMEHFTGRHHLIDPQDIADVASYVSSLPPVKTPNVGDGKLAEFGASAYQNACATCHGASAEGDARGVPRLAGQHFAYLLRQMQDVVEGRRTDLPAEHRMLLQRFEGSDLSAVADYLARLNARD
jgi:cbb3-type cytochrome c oxidase subunit III